MTDYGRLIDDFNTKSTRFENLLNEMSVLLEARRVPSESDAHRLQVAIEELRDAYSQVKAAAMEVSEAVADDQPADVYEAVLAEHSKRLRVLELARLLETLERFSRIASDEAFYADAFESYRQEALALLASLRSPEKTIDEKLAESCDDQRDLLEAIEMKDLGNPEGEALSERIEGAFSRQVCHGVYFHKYYIEDDDVRKCAPIPSRSAETSTKLDKDSARPEVSEPVNEVEAGDAGESSESAMALEGQHKEPSESKPETDIRIAPDNLEDETPAGSDAVHGNSSRGAEELLQSQNPIRDNLKVSVKGFKNDLLRARNAEVRSLLPILTTFGALPVASLTSLARMCCPDELSDGFAERLSAALEFLKRKNVVATFSPVEGDTVYALTSYGRAMVNKQSVRLMKFPSNNRNFWLWPIYEHEFTADSLVERRALEAVIEQNDPVVAYLNAIFEQEGFDAVAPIVNSLKRIDEAYQVMVPWDDELYECLVVDDVANRSDGELGTLLVTKYGERPGPSGDVVEDLFLMDGSSLLKWNDGWVERESEGAPRYEESDESSMNPDEPKGPFDLTSAILPSEETPHIEQIEQSTQEKLGEPTEKPKNDSPLRDAVEDDDIALIDETSEETKSEGAESEDQPLAFRLGTLVDGPNQPTDGELVSLIDDILDRRDLSLSSGDQFADLAAALTLAKAASTIKGYELSRLRCNQLALAVNALIVDHEYTGEFIGQAFPEYTEANETLAFATYCWALFSPTRSYDQPLYSTVKTLWDSFDDIFPSLGPCKSLFNVLMDVHDVRPEGFTSTVLNMMGSESERRRKLEQLSSKAKSLKDLPIIKTKMNGLPQLIRKCFGQGSRLYECMQIISSNAPKDPGIVRKTLSAYGYGEDDPCEKVTDEVTEEIDDVWSRVTVKQSTQNVDLRYIARDKVEQAYKERIDIMQRWLSLMSDSLDQSVLKQLRALRRSILATIAAIKADPALDSVPQSIVIVRLLGSLEHRLNGTNWDHPLFASLLQSPYISLNAGMLPDLMEQLNEVKYYEPWRMALKHAAGSLVSLEEARDLILESDSEFFDNYRQLRLINQILNDGAFDQEQVSQNCSQAEGTATRKAREFEDHLEISYAYGQIDEIQKEDLGLQLESYLELCSEEGESDRDFGHLQQFIEALHHQVDDMSEAQGRWLKEQLERYKRDCDTPESCELLAEAEKLLAEEKNYAVVEDYLNRYEAGETRLADEAALRMREPDLFSEFISDDVYAPIFEFCIQRTEQDFSKFSRQYTNDHYPDEWGDTQKKNSGQLLLKWPGFSGNYSDLDYSKALPVFLKRLGIRTSGPAKRVNVTGPDRIFQMNVVPEPHDLLDYPHPIAEYGTRAKSPLTVLLLPGQFSTAQEIVHSVRSQGSHDIDIVIIDHPLSQETRREVAKLAHTSYANLDMFLLIDQVLAIYLALHAQIDRLPLLLKCTLPFTRYQPFVRGSGSVDDEMFYGRSRELSAIMDPKGATVVYGGRQLGKTALLERARSICNNKKKGEYAVYVNIDGCDTEEKACQRIAKAIREAKLKIDDASSTEDLRDAILRMMGKSKGLTRFLLLIDEADDFLAGISASGYGALVPLTTLMRESGNKFKFVLAGLHNVSRFKSAALENSVFGQLGEPLCIKPLSPTDALRLISRPLTYLGFQVGSYPNLETILTNTNYYPGIIQFFGYTLIESMTERYEDYYQPNRGNPPYTLKKEQLGAIMNSTALNNSIREKFRLSLELDSRYYMIARCLAILYYDNGSEPGAGRLREGFTVDDIREWAEGLEIKCLEGISDHDFIALLDEMRDMGILVRPTENVPRFRFRRRSFVSIIGASEEELWDSIAENNE